jgi:hypothetical protein
LYNDFSSPHASMGDAGPIWPDSAAPQPSNGTHNDANRLTIARQRLQQAQASYRAVLMTESRDARHLD